MGSRTRLVWAAALAAIAPVSPCLAQASPTPAAALTPETGALVAEIDRLTQSDRDGDPKAAKQRLLALLARVEADGKVPPLSRGELHAMLMVAEVDNDGTEAALGWLDKAEADYREAGGARDKQAEVLHNRASLLRRLRKLDAAEAAAREAIAIRRDLYGENNQDVASSIGALSGILYSQGRFEEAVEASREALAIQEAVGPDDALRMVIRLDSVASQLDDSGRHAEAARVARREETLAREKLGTAHQWYGYAINTLGQTLLNQGMTDQAIPVLRQTLDWRREHLGETHPYTAAAMLVLSVALEEAGDLEQANAMTEAALPNLLANKAVMGPNALAGFYQRIARIAAALGNWDLYDKRIAEGFAEVDAVLPETNPSRAFFHVYHALQLERRGRTAEALPIAEQWVPRLRSLIPENNNRILGEMLLARLHQQAGAPAAQVLAEVAPVAQVLAAKLSDLSASERELARDARANAAAVLLYLDTALAAGDTQRAFEAAQLVSMSDLSLAQQRAADLGDTAAAERDPARAAHRRLIEQARISRQLEARYRAALDRSDDAAAAALQPQVEASRAALATAEADLRGRFPDYVARFRPAAVALEDFRRGLAPGDLVLIPVEAEGQGYSLRIDREHGLVADRFDTAELGGLAATLRAALAGGGEGAAFPYAAAARLYRMLLPGGVPQGGRLLLHGGNKVATLPLAVLTTADYAGPPAAAPWLVRRASVEVLGNLSAAPDSERAATGRDVRVAGIGGAALPAGATPARPVEVAALFRSGLPEAATIADLPPLPGAEGELRAIAAAWPGSDDLILVGPNAYEERLKTTDLSHARLLAFATHGLVSGEMAQVWEPALLVGTAPGSGEDGLLGASEIARMKLDADWVILSACNTAAGDGTLGPAYSGLAAAFAQAGARALMLSHWRVRDDAAARLTVDTVKGAAAGLSRAEALRRAQLALMADAGVPDAGNPAVWAPFVIIAD